MTETPNPAEQASAAAAQAAEEARVAQEELRAAIQKAEEAAARAALAAAAADLAPGTEAQSPPAAEPEAVVEAAAIEEPEGAADSPAPLVSVAAVADITSGYRFDGPAITIGALKNGAPVPEALIRVPLAMLNRHALVAGATGTGKTTTLQLLAEQLSAHGVPVFAADIKGDLSGIATPGAGGEKLLARTGALGQNWAPRASVTEFFTLGGLGIGVPIRTTLERFGPLMLAKVLGLNQTQESSLALVFHYAEEQGLPLLNIADLRALLGYLTSDTGKAEIRAIGGLSSQTVGVIQRAVIAFADQGADVFFGEPEIDPHDFLRLAADGTGIVSLLEVPSVQDRPALFSTFLMFLLGELFRDLPEVGDLEKPKLVFFFDEAHLLFADASPAFLRSITQTVRLIRSKGVGIVFVTQTPKDVPADVLAQLGSRIQHALRAHTPDDAKALKATVSTFPRSELDLATVLPSLGTGEAVVTVLGEQGTPTPVAVTRLWAPQGTMGPTPEANLRAAVAASPLLERYGSEVNAESAEEMLAERALAEEAARVEAEAEKQRLAEEAREAKAAEKEAERLARAEERKREQAEARRERERAAAQKKTANQVGSVMTSAARTFVNEALRKVFRRR